MANGPNIFQMLLVIRLYSTRYFCSYYTRFCLLYSYCFLHFCLLSDHRMGMIGWLVGWGMIKVAIIDTVPMPITRHSARFLYHFENALNDTVCMSTL